jgi:Flp pilus assembly protein TadG
MHPERGMRAIMTGSKTMPVRRRSGNSIIELTFMMPWLLFLFVGVFDTGFYCYALIATQNAARAAAVHNSISKTAATDPDSSGCQIVISELSTAAYGRTLTGCNTQTLQVESDYCPGPQGSSPSSSSSTQKYPCPPSIGNTDAVQVVVTYQSALLIPIPGLLQGQLTINRTALMQVNPSADF